LAFYYFLGTFPAILLLLLLLDMFPGSGLGLRDTLLDCFRRIFPPDASALITKAAGEMDAKPAIGAGALGAAFGSAWTILNGTWAMMVGLNKAYEVKEDRQWWRIIVIAFGLTASLGTMGLIALGAIFYGSRAGATAGQQLGAPTPSSFLLGFIQWPIIVALLFVSIASLYRYGPNLKGQRWRWSTPGAAVATVLWIASTLLLRMYQEHFGSSQRIYGGLKPVVTLLLWLYFTGAAILVGGEANSEIEKAVSKGHSALRRP
jgi:membrane protein